MWKYRMVSKSKETCKKYFMKHEKKNCSFNLKNSEDWTDHLWLEASDQTILEIKILKLNLGCQSYNLSLICFNLL